MEMELNVREIMADAWEERLLNHEGSRFRERRLKAQLQNMSLNS